MANRQSDKIIAYRDHFREAATLLKVLAHHIENLGHEDLATIHWGDVGNAGRIAEWMRVPVSMVLNLDATDPELPAAIDAYLAEHGLLTSKERRS